MASLKKATFEDIRQSLEPDVKHTDVHKVLAARLFSVPYEKVTDDQRRYSKTVAFTRIYGGNHGG